MKIFGWGKKKENPSLKLDNDEAIFAVLQEFVDKSPFSDEAMFGEYVHTRQFQYSKKILDMSDYISMINKDESFSTFTKTIFRDIKASYDKIEELWKPFVLWDKAVDYIEHLKNDKIKIGQLAVPYSIALELYFILQQKDIFEYLDKSGYRFLDINGIDIDAKNVFGFYNAESVSAFVKLLPTHFSIEDNKFIEIIASIYNQSQNDISVVMEQLWGYSHFDTLWEYQSTNVSFYPYLPNKVVLEPDHYYQNWYESFSSLTSSFRSKELEIIHLNGIIETSNYFISIASMFSNAYLSLSKFKRFYRYKNSKGMSIQKYIKEFCGDKFEEELTDTLQLLMK